MSDDSFFGDHYINWRKSRFNGTLKYINSPFFKDKTLLELGGGYGDNGFFFKNMGSIVTSSDAREEHTINGKSKYPDLEFIVLDCDKDKINKKYDIILHWGVLYHMDKIAEHLDDVCDKCNYLLLETEVCDSTDNLILKVDERDYYDQSFHFKGSRPSASTIEQILHKNNFNFKLITDGILNSDFHIYDWEVKNTNTWRHGLRRFWICWKNNVVSPLN